MRARGGPALLLALACLTLAGPRVARAAPLERDVVEGGDHWRLETENGAVHVWRPSHFEASTAGVVVYVHGYYTTADGTWEDDGLAAQFRESRQNAIFIVPESPSANRQEVRWRSVTALMQDVTRRTSLALPKGPIVLIGHSGAIRTLSRWLGDVRLKELILLDAVYGSSGPLRYWLRSAAHRLILVAGETLSRSLRLVQGFRGVARRSSVPEDVADLSRYERKARVLLMESQYGHMDLVNNGKVIPVLLRLSPLPPL